MVTWWGGGNLWTVLSWQQWQPAGGLKAHACARSQQTFLCCAIQVYTSVCKYKYICNCICICADPHQTLQFMHACAPSKLSSVCKPQVYLHLYFYLDLYLLSFPPWANIPIVQLCEETQIHGDTIACTRISNFPKYCQVHASTWKHQQVNCTKCIHPRCFLDCIYSGSAILAL